MLAVAEEEALLSANRNKRRLQVLNELVATEASYNDDLKHICTTYIQPMRRSGILSHIELARLFSNVELLYDASTELLEDLRKRLGEQTFVCGVGLGRVGRGACSQPLPASARSQLPLWLQATTPDAPPSLTQVVNARIGDVFLERVEFLMPAYTSYCSNHTTALASIARLRKKRGQFDHFLKDIASSPGAVSLPSLVIKPIQRCVAGRGRERLDAGVELTSCHHARTAESADTRFSSRR
jgi:hypothetical protein